MENRWSSSTKRTVAIFSVITVLFLIYRVSAILPPLILTLVLAYILSPAADFLTTRFHLKRIFAVAIIYLVLIAVLVTLPALFVPSLIDQIQSSVEGLPDLIQEMGERVQEPIVFGEFTLDLQAVYDQASSSIQGILTSLGTQTISILTNVASAVIWLLFILVASFYLVKDSATIMQWVDKATPPSFRDDARQLRSRIAASWNAFLRGQLILMIVMGVAVGTTMALIGLPHAWLIGILFGFLELIPNLGPVIASIPVVLIAYFQGSTALNISNEWFTVLVIAVNVALQQIENNVLVPRIMGHSLNLHPLVVLIAAIIGAQTAGLLGLLLAAPTVATLRIVAEYTYRRLFDMPPFPDNQTQSQAETTGQQAPDEDRQIVSVAQPVETSESEQPE